MNHETKSVRLLVQGIELVGRHGIYPEEGEAGNRFRVDVAIRGDLAAAADSDDIDDTIDYQGVVRLVSEVNRRRRFNLIESFAGALADGLLDRFPRGEEVFVRVRKLAPMNLGNVSCATVEVKKHRE